MSHTKETDRSTSFRTANDEQLSCYKYMTSRALRAFNKDDDDTMPEQGTLDSLTARRMLIAKGLLGLLGANVNIQPPFFVTWGCNLFVGDNVYMNRKQVHSFN